MRRQKFELFPLRESPYKPPETEEPDTTFKRKYPPDSQLGQELADNARVWNVYRDEAIQHDDGLLAGWNNSIDILLTFAGLFSAAVTAFVIESYHFLQPAELDLGSALYALAVNDTVTLRMLAVASSQPSRTAEWINGLWFTSLFLSLAAAFLCILVKQWLDEYTARTRASSQNPKHWARRRAFYFRAIDKWRVSGIISLLPLLLHAALFLFFAGMVLLLWSLSGPMAAWISALTCLLLLLYAVSVLIPVWHAACPFATPLAKQLRRSWSFMCIWVLHRGLFVSETLAALAARWRAYWQPETDLEAACPHPRSIHLWLVRNAIRDTVEKPSFDQLLELKSLRSADTSIMGISEADLVDDLDCEVICWLLLAVSDGDANAVGFQALGAIEPPAALARLLSNRGISSSASGYRWLLTSLGEGTSAEAARVVRSILVLNCDDGAGEGKFVCDCFNDPRSVRQVRQLLGSGSLYPDTLLLEHALYVPLSAQAAVEDLDYRVIRAKAAGWKSSPTLHSTAMLLASLNALRRHHLVLFLLCCDLGRVSPAQWSRLMPKLWGNSGSCPSHSQLTACNSTCLPELLSRLILAGANDLDPIALSQLFDTACGRLDNVPLTDRPSFVAYLASNSFMAQGHSTSALYSITSYFENPSTWSSLNRMDLTWLKAWRHAAYACHLQSGRVYGPPTLIAASLHQIKDDHIWDQEICYRYRFDASPPREETIRIILCIDGDATKAIPSIWTLIAKEDYGPIRQFTVTLEALTTALCAMSRAQRGVDMSYIDAVFAPITLTSVLRELYFLSRWLSENRPEYQGFETTALSICSHIMELRPCWWTEGMEDLMHRDGDAPVQSLWIEPHITLSVLQYYAVAITKRCLGRGPCYNCPLTVAPLAFDASLRAFAVYPFAVYPIVDPEDGN